MATTDRKTETRSNISPNILTTVNVNGLISPVKDKDCKAPQHGHSSPNSLTCLTFSFTAPITITFQYLFVITN